MDPKVHGAAARRAQKHRCAVNALDRLRNRISGEGGTARLEGVRYRDVGPQQTVEPVNPLDLRTLRDVPIRRGDVSGADLRLKQRTHGALGQQDPAFEMLQQPFGGRPVISGGIRPIRLGTRDEPVPVHEQFAHLR